MPRPETSITTQAEIDHRIQVADAYMAAHRCLSTLSFLISTSRMLAHVPTPDTHTILTPTGRQRKPNKAEAARMTAGLNDQLLGLAGWYAELLDHSRQLDAVGPPIATLAESLYPVS